MIGSGQSIISHSQGILQALEMGGDALVLLSGCAGLG